MNFTNMKDYLIAMTEMVASASPPVPKNPVVNLEAEHPNAFNWVDEQICSIEWRMLRKLARNREDIQQRWNDRLERNRIKNSVNGLGKEKIGKKL